MTVQAEGKNSTSWNASYRRKLLQKKLTWFFTGSQMIVDLATIYCSILGGYGLYGYQFHAAEDYFAQYVHLAIAGTLIGFFFFERVGLYRYQPSMMNLIEIRKILRAVFLIFLVLMGYAYYMGSSFSAGAIIYAFCLAMVLLIIERMFFFKLQQHFHLSGFSIRQVLIYGAGETGRLLFHGISQTPKLGYWVAAFYDQDKQKLETARSLCSREEQNGPVFVDNSDQLSEVIRENEIEEIFVSNPLHDGDNQDFEKVRRLCRTLRLKLSFIPYIRGYSARQVQVNDINGITMISFGEVRISHAEQISKKIFDLTLASLILLILSPVFALISMAIKRDSPGPVFFKQIRVGKDGVRFPMFKFRTMYEDSPEYSRSPRTSDDPRITTLGKFLRRTSLDELPQLINVLRGEMSLVGPRPEMPFIVDNEYSDIHWERLRVMPGITGIWQISADRTREIHENISYDLFYIENRSLLLDIIILARTLIFGIMAMRTH